MKLKLSDMGTTGLINYVINGPGGSRFRGARMGKAKRVIAKRFGRWENVNAFNRAVNRAEGY